MPPKQRHRPIALSAQLIELGGAVPSEIRLLPSGEFRARDGRPKGLKAWVMNSLSATTVLAAAGTQQDKFLIDYDHQTLYTREHGQPAPAAGWFSQLEWRDGLGLFATDVEWTPAARTAIESREYRYISPVLTYNPESGAVTSVLMAALVNYPALDGLTDLAAAHFQIPHSEALSMELDDLLSTIRTLLNLPVTSTAEDISAELGKLQTMISQSGPVACNSLTGLLTQQSEQIASLSARLEQQPDPAQFVPLSAVTELQQRVAELSAQALEHELNTLIQPALADGRLMQAQKDWAEALGKSDLSALKGFLETAQPIAALKGTQTHGQPPDLPKPASLNVPAGYAVDPDQAALHTRIVAYQQEHQTDYLTAALAVGA